METPFWLELVLILGCWRVCQSSALVINVVELSSVSNHTFVYNVSPSTNLTRWTHLVGSTAISLMSYQNERCTATPSGYFLGDRRYSYACNSTIHYVTLHLTGFNGGLDNRIISCRDALQPDETGSTWMIQIKDTDNSCSYCKPTMTFGVKDISEGDNVTFVCRVSSDVPYVYWNRNIGSNTAAIGVQNEKCTTQGTTFLDDTSKYNYTCNDTVYQVTILNVQRSEHNDIYMCTPLGQPNGMGSNWIIKVRAQVTSVTITSPGYLVNVRENTPIDFTCTTSTARPVATIYWYRHQNRQDSQETQITSNVTATTDYNDLSVTTSILRLFVTRQDNDTNVFCTANNPVNTTELRSTSKRLLNVLHAPRAAGEVNTNITSANNASKTITVNVIAYPPPTFTWSQLIKGTWTLLNKNNDFVINSSAVQSNLTIRRVGMDDFTKYRVVVTNEFGQMETTFTLSPYGITYPPPKFTWSKLMNGMWTPLDNNNQFVINSSNVQSNLTIRRVGMDDFTKYQVVVKNKVGQMKQNFTPSPYGIPDTPTEFRQIQSHTTTSSIHIEWKPGYNGGPTQTFYIKCKKNSDTAWTYFTVIDSGEELMNISLTSLADDTQYDIVIFASNIIGNSSESPVLLASTKATHTNLGPLIGGIAGGVTAFLIIVVAIIVVFRRFTLFKECWEKRSRRKSDGTNDSAEEHAYYNTGRLENIINKNNDATAYDEIGSVTDRDNNSAEDATSNNVARVPNYEMVNLNNVESPQYSSLDQTEQCTTDDTSSVDNRAVYENMKIKAF